MTAQERFEAYWKDRISETPILDDLPSVKQAHNITFIDADKAVWEEAAKAIDLLINHVCFTKSICGDKLCQLLHEFSRKAQESQE